MTQDQFDHLALGVRHWADGTDLVVQRLGGAWSHGGVAPEFAPCQVGYGRGINLELIAPGSGSGGFMQRFLDRGGPRPHHLTFKAGDLDATLDALAALGIRPLDGSSDYRREVFLHPLSLGFGVLVQLVGADDAEAHYRPPAPEGFPAPQRPPRVIAWVGLTVASAERAHQVFGDVLGGHVTSSGPGWSMLSWGEGRALLLREAGAAAGTRVLWPDDRPGVGHLAVGDCTTPEEADWQVWRTDPEVNLRVVATAAEGG
jgi:hypothetical protein